MKYSVAVQDERGNLVGEFNGLNEKEAIKTAKEQASIEYRGHKVYQVYITFFRPSDGQHGYLNRLGHAIIGKPW